MSQFGIYFGIFMLKMRLTFFYLISYIAMKDKLKQDELVSISKEELQRLYRIISEYEKLLQQLKKDNQHYTCLLTQTKAS